MTRHVADWGGAYLLERRNVAAIVDRVMPAEGRSLAGYGRASFAWAERRGCVLYQDPPGLTRGASPTR